MIVGYGNEMYDNNSIAESKHHQNAILRLMKYGRKSFRVNLTTWKMSHEMLRSSHIQSGNCKTKGFRITYKYFHYNNL